MHGPDVTSELRTKLAGAVCRSVEQADRKVKLDLALALATLPFESMTDDALIDMAYRYCAPDTVTTIVTTASAEVRSIRAAFHCGHCLDQKVVKGDDERWRRCSNCNVDARNEPKVPA